MAQVHPLLATLLSGCIFNLLAFPDKITALLGEFHGNFDKLEDLAFKRLAELKYMNACLKEALRIYPPVLIGSLRVVLPGGQQILGKWVPPETRVSIYHWSTYKSEANFKNADTFATGRWLRTDPANAGDALDAHQPFGFGPRN
ncbi:averantin hydroxylase [Colletotrichum spaethianum]|uniref:Averantin hydroxylase n=1 Tax=Colletotrichum spaethianum TaxID=700344 RepID=A0AA37LAZ0_9PEZI|nr:averantin hydroxylase [Colletotrichum spaethianum]GKT45031.1 averantin hydroxylase [Colletotrichum spaethianum]